MYIASLFFSSLLPGFFPLLINEGRFIALHFGMSWQLAEPNCQNVVHVAVLVATLPYRNLESDAGWAVTKFQLMMYLAVSLTLRLVGKVVKYATASDLAAVTASVDCEDMCTVYSVCPAMLLTQSDSVNVKPSVLAMSSNKCPALSWVCT